MQKKASHDVLALTQVPVVTGDGDGSSNLCESSSSDSSTNGTPRNRGLPSPPRGLAGGLRKLSYVPPPVEDAEEEMQAEIKRSCATHDCNLSALNLSVVPHGIPFDTLTKLSLSENKLTSLPEEAFTGVNGQNLVDLDVNSNELSALPQSLFFLPKLEVLMLNHNKIVKLPSVVSGVCPSSAGAILPAIERIGLEFNELEDNCVSLVSQCPNLKELLLGQNSRVLDEEVPLTVLLESPIAKAWNEGRRTSKLIVRIDNRPRFMMQVQKQDWANVLPWIELSLHKIYPDKVLDYLYLGSMRTAQTVTVYHDFDIGYVLTIGRDLDVLIEPGMKHKILLIDDYPGADITAVFSEAFEFIDEARAAKKGILIHCFAGLSRSVTIAAAYIMSVNHLTCDQALALIREVRPAACPNDGFLRLLKVNEEKLMSGGFHRR